MLEKIKNQLLKINEAVGIDINILNNGELLIYGIRVKNTNKGLVKINEFERVKDLADLRKLIPKNIPVVASLNGKGVLMKAAPGLDPSSESMLSEIFPGLNPNDFFYSSSRIGNNTYLHIARKELAEDIYSQLIALDINVLGVVLGIGNAELILPFIQNGSHSLNTPVYNISVHDNQLQEIILLDNSLNLVFEELLIGDRYYKTASFIAHTIVLELFAAPLKTLDFGLDIPGIKKAREEFCNYIIFKFTAWSILSFVFFILVVNSFLFKHYFDKEQELQVTKSILSDQLVQNKSYNIQVDSIYTVLTSSGWDTPTKHSYFIDRIAALVPETITLNTIQSSPLQETTGQTSFIFQSSRLIVKGISDDPSDLNMYINSIKNINNIQSVDLADYLYKRELHAATFTLRILTDNINTK